MYTMEFILYKEEKNSEVWNAFNRKSEKKRTTAAAAAAAAVDSNNSRTA